VVLAETGINHLPVQAFNKRQGIARTKLFSIFNLVPVKKDYKLVDSGFRREVQKLAQEKQFVDIDYISDLKELLPKRAMIHEMFSRDEAEFIKLGSGEEIRLDKLVRINGKVSPGYSDYDFGNSCAL
jgi:Rho-binding antiterminator